MTHRIKRKRRFSTVVCGRARQGSQRLKPSTSLWVFCRVRSVRCRAPRHPSIAPRFAKTNTFPHSSLVTDSSHVLLFHAQVPLTMICPFREFPGHPRFSVVAAVVLHLWVNLVLKLQCFWWCRCLRSQEENPEYLQPIRLNVV